MARAGITTGIIVAGLLLGAGVARADTGLSAVASIIPVTGPSVGPGSSEAGAPELIPAVIPADTKTGNPSAKGGTSRLTPRGHATPGTTKAAHKPASKSTVKKTSGATTKHVAKSGAATKAKHVATTKPKVSAQHAMVGKPIPVTKHHSTTPAAKSGATAEPVLPRV